MCVCVCGCVCVFVLLSTSVQWLACLALVRGRVQQSLFLSCLHILFFFALVALVTAAFVYPALHASMFSKFVLRCPLLGLHASCAHSWYETTA
jgi:hypothetical protein